MKTIETDKNSIHIKLKQISLFWGSVIDEDNCC